jgi:hypothetical protein
MTGTAAALTAGVALLTCVTGCRLRGLAHDQLYGPADAGHVLDVAGPDDRADARAGDDTSADDAPDASDDGAPDLATDVAGEAADSSPPPCAVDSCGDDQFCDDLSGRCIPRAGTGMLSGAVFDACNHTVVDTKIGIAGRRQCSAAQKGAYYFSGLPLGKLTVTAAAPGYDLFVAVVTIVPGGNVMDVPLARSSPVGCADPKPAAVLCSCVESGCP